MFHMNAHINIKINFSFSQSVSSLRSVSLPTKSPQLMVLILSFLNDDIYIYDIFKINHFLSLSLSLNQMDL